MVSGKIEGYLTVTDLYDTNKKFKTKNLKWPVVAVRNERDKL